MQGNEEAAPFSAAEETLIRAIRPAMAAMMRAFEEDLRPQGLSHTEYLILIYLSEAPGRSMRLGDLAGNCLQSASAIGRTVRRLEAGGLVRRQQDPQDARSFNAVLTDAGLARLERAQPVHYASARRHLFSHLEGIDLDQLAKAFQRMADQA
jgi:DNA-binding MarR family transcriptional regulator